MLEICIVQRSFFHLYSFYFRFIEALDITPIKPKFTKIYIAITYVESLTILIVIYILVYYTCRYEGLVFFAESEDINMAIKIYLNITPSRFLYII